MSADLWCVDCGCWFADHDADLTCGACGDCYHPRFESPDKDGAA